MRLLKGHGTENDFVLLPDLDGAVDLDAALVRALCDRHAGIGGDGVLRVVRSENDADGAPMAAEAPFFMDYRNADGSIAEMCGNGIRVFMRYLQGVGLVETDATVATRGGVKRVRSASDGNVSVCMGRPRILADRPVVTVAPIGASLALRSVEMPNPHVVISVENAETLNQLELARSPGVEPGRPDGQNIEFVVRSGPRWLSMRVHERGVGETRSCGTGICAVVVAVADADGSGADGSTWRVDVPGGSCTVEWRSDGEVVLTGPAVLVGEIELDEAWLAAARARER